MHASDASENYHQCYQVYAQLVSRASPPSPLYARMCLSYSCSSEHRTLMTEQKQHSAAGRQHRASPSCRPVGSYTLFRLLTLLSRVPCKIHRFIGDSLVNRNVLGTCNNTINTLCESTATIWFASSSTAFGTYPCSGSIQQCARTRFNCIPQAAMTSSHLDQPGIGQCERATHRYEREHTVAIKDSRLTRREGSPLTRMSMEHGVGQLRKMQICATAPK
jgi:hypothetical protein